LSLSDAGVHKMALAHEKEIKEMLRQLIRDNRATYSTLSKEMSLTQVAEKVRQFLNLDKGEVELIVGFRYKKVTP
jgi:hypothetical protein